MVKSNVIFSRCFSSHHFVAHPLIFWGKFQYCRDALFEYHWAVVQDSPDFLRSIEDQNNSDDIEDEDILVTIDVTGLYSNIPMDDGIKACKDILENSDNPDALNCLILELLELVLKNNIFEFDDKLYRQEIGTAMGCRPAPDYANIFMAQIDDRILKTAELLFQDSDKIKMF